MVDALVSERSVHGESGAAHVRSAQSKAVFSSGIHTYKACRSVHHRPLASPRLSLLFSLPSRPSTHLLPPHATTRNHERFRHHQPRFGVWTRVRCAQGAGAWTQLSRVPQALVPPASRLCIKLSSMQAQQLLFNAGNLQHVSGRECPAIP